MYAVLDSYLYSIQGTACQIKKAFYHAEGFPAHLCHHIEDRKRIRILLEQELREGKYTQAFFDAIDKSYKDILVQLRNFTLINFSSASHNELLSYYQIFYQIYLKTIHPMVLAIYASDLQDLFESELKKVLPQEKQTTEYVLASTSIFLTPSRLTTVQKEEQLLFEIECAFEKGNVAKTKEASEIFFQKKEIKEKLQNLEKNYGSFHMEYIGEPWKVSDYKAHLWKRIQEISSKDWKDQKSPEDRLDIIKNQQKDFFLQHQSSFLQDLVFAMQEFLIVLDYSKADLVEGIYLARPLLEEIGKRTEAGSWIDIRYLLPYEVEHMLEHKITVHKDLIEKRKGVMAMLLSGNTISVYDGKQALHLREQLIQKYDTENIKELKGLTAHPGKVRGKVTLVTGAHDRAKFNKGDIMVTRDTTTELTSIIKKASAIVADQGGLLSHTALVAREFKIPCIVQSKIGTKIFQDGDLIEVDADNGIVRKL